MPSNPFREYLLYYIVYFLPPFVKKNLLHGTCPVVPLLMHRLGAGNFFVCLSCVLFMQLCRCDSFTPRGGGQRDRERFANLSLSLQHLSTHSGRSLRRDITANRVVYTNIVCAIPVRSLVATSIGCAAVCVRAGIACVSAGM